MECGGKGAVPATPLWLNRQGIGGYRHAVSRRQLFQREPELETEFLRLQPQRPASQRLVGVHREVTAIERRDWQEVDAVVGNIAGGVGARWVEGLVVEILS